MPAASFIAALQSSGPAADRADKMGLYGWLVGDWEMDAVLFPEDGPERKARGEIHFIWALEGRAIMDVWILPGSFYGSTLRVYDPAIDAWRIHWSDPIKQLYTRQIGRAEGKDIVQLGRSESGEPVRWSFRDITQNSFCWRAERSRDGGESWRLEAEFKARRIGV